MRKDNQKMKNIDVILLILPFVAVTTLGVLFFLFPKESVVITDYMRNILGEKLGWFYMLLGLGVFLTTLLVEIGGADV